ncbi:hypothetical protein [Haladaptatus sp. DYSN1]|uniref:hypothetical protein n=1 Tax=unclassified Haladaptatus TaxID=2622732 RepID=UPI002405C964|nr:hypothetical protein [Haladaptatus sp. DYSN1]
MELALEHLDEPANPLTPDGLPTRGLADRADEVLTLMEFANLLDMSEIELRIRRRIDLNIEKDAELAKVLATTRSEHPEPKTSFGGDLDEKTREAFDALNRNAGPSNLNVEPRGE